MIGEMTPAEIEEFLHRENVARLGCHSDGRTYVVPITFVYEGTSLIGHSAEGRKIWMMRADRHVCVELDRFETPGRWRSVIAWGDYEELSGDDAAAALGTLVTRFKAMITSETALPPPDHGHAHGHGAASADLNRRKAVVFRIRLKEKHGRFERR
ncbi:MAG: pyridoxamine 5'-phosphate oxidase family protein [Alphaproteobacteria bacterium]|nr:pyridoxamine 5'-phosphate oxidase family protein [Alphaproteobacteria bacterium]